MFKFFMIIATIISFYIGMRRIFVFIHYRKHKKHYFIDLAFGAMFKFKVIRVCIVLKNQRNEDRQVMLVRKKGKTNKIMNISKVGRIDLELVKVFFHSTVVEKADIGMKIGFSDAKDTCLFCGFILALVNAVLPIFHKNIKIEKTKVRVTPIFKIEKFSIDLDCILKIDLVNIIIRYLKYRKNKKEKAVLKNASNREYYASNNE